MNEDNWKGSSSLVSTIVLLLTFPGGDYEFLFRPLIYLGAWHTAVSLQTLLELGTGWVGLPLVAELKSPLVFPFFISTSVSLFGPGTCRAGLSQRLYLARVESCNHCFIWRMLFLFLGRVP